jgi:hypothetical protein
MANGSVVVIGGESGAGGAADNTLEILPRIPGGSTVVSLDWLKPTSGYNYYPFANVLPCGDIFIGEFETTDFSTFLTDTHGQRITMRHVFLTR